MVFFSKKDDLDNIIEKRNVPLLAGIKSLKIKDYATSFQDSPFSLSSIASSGSKRNSVFFKLVLIEEPKGGALPYEKEYISKIISLRMIASIPIETYDFTNKSKSENERCATSFVGNVFYQFLTDNVRLDNDSIVKQFHEMNVDFKSLLEKTKLLNSKENQDIPPALKNIFEKMKKLFVLSPWKTVKNAITLTKRDFKWQAICADTSSRSVGQLRTALLRLGKKVSPSKTKAEMCLALAENLYYRDPSCADQTSLKGDSFRDIPSWRIYKIGEQCFDIFSLEKLESNPYTRAPLPRNLIVKRLDILRELLEDHGGEERLVVRVKNSTILSPETSLARTWTNFVGNHLIYTVSPEVILKSTDSQLDDLVSRLLLTNEILNIPSDTSNKIISSSGLPKKIALVDALVEILKTNREEKALVLYSAFVNQLKRKRGDSLEDDPYEYMTN